MREIFINKARACAFTGHRILYKDFNKNKVEKVIEEVVDKGFNTFLVGMAIGFDTVCFQILEKIREKKQLKIIACVPCKKQDLNFNKEQKKEYKRLLSVADEVIILSEEYTQNCMKKRNEFMVDNASLLITYLRNNLSGTSNTVKYARKKELLILEV